MVDFLALANSFVVQAILVCALCMFFAGILIPQILLISFRRRLFDEPDERKIHKGTVPRLGGMAFTPVICFSMSLLLGFGYLIDGEIADFNVVIDGRSVSFGLCALLMLYIVGLADDLVGIRYRAKFVVQLFCASLLVGGGLACCNLYGVLGLDAIPLWAGVPLTMLVVVYVVNAINLIDGIDGLASGLSIAAFLVYGISFAFIGNSFYALLSFAGLGVLIPFFYYNVFGDPSKGKKIFMGDTGSLTIGLILVFLGLAFLESADSDMSLMSGLNPMVVVVSPLIIPCFDVLRVFLHRIRHHGNPFLPDKTHIHHKLLALGLKQRVAMSVIVTAAVCFSVGNILLSRFLEINVLLLVDLVIWTVANYWLSKVIEKKNKVS